MIWELVAMALVRGHEQGLLRFLGTHSSIEGRG